MRRIMSIPEFQTPEWVKDAVFYQIFPDRFARSERSEHAPGLQFKAWGASPREQGFQGGDLYGIAERLDYLQELGVTALYLNPIFASAANHRYHTFDYYQVDPLLGGNDALRHLIDELHARDMHIVLDGVFNHASRGFWPFHHVLENGRESPYLDWFIIKDWPLRPYHNDRKNHHNYEAWWDLPALPKLNTDNPGVRRYILEIARYWIDFGIDGWRLDVPSEIDDDAFWQEFRRTVKEGNPEAYIVGEIWHEARRWLSGDQFDAVMNYLFMGPILSYAGATSLRPDYRRENLTLEPMSGDAFRREIETALGYYPWSVNLVQLNLIDSHDTARARWIMGEDDAAQRLALMLQITLPGAPCIYYGDEIGMSAGDDPDCREAFPWHEEASWNGDLLDFYRRATRLRRELPQLRRGDYRTLLAAESLLAFERATDEGTVVVLANAGLSDAVMEFELSGVKRDLVEVWPADAAEGAAPADGGTPERYEGGAFAVPVPARSVKVLRTE